MEALRKEAHITPETPVQFLKGVGEGRAALLETAGLRTAGDLLYFFPFRFEDRRHPVTVRDLRNLDQPVTLRGRIVSAGLKISPVRRLQIFEAIFDDGTGTVMLVWFNQPYLAEKIQKNDFLAIYGQPRLSSYGRFQIENPDWEKLALDREPEEEGSIIPVYSTVSGIPSKRVRQFVTQSLQAVSSLEDPLPPELRMKHRLQPLNEAIVTLHRPDELTAEFLAQRSPAHQRLIFQEFFAFQLALRVRHALEEKREKRRRITVDDAIREQVRAILPFRLTNAQKRVLKEIVDDLQSASPMYRLVQGDVGSGKTIVALITALVVIANGHQAALLAPTEILAEQHFQRIGQLVDGSIRVAKLTGSTPAREKKALLAAIAVGEVDLVVGTHALIESAVQFHSLGLAIVDEQHRFGVAQRQKLFEKGDLVDILVMTATPIPRSLALALYGDLELSVVDELPPGRVPIKTAVRGSAQIPKILSFVDERIAAGEQAYCVFPLIEESEKVDLKALSTGFDTIVQALPGRRLAMLHGRMPAEEKEETMQRFKRGEIDVLVSTTVIEVGIDVPNASVMIILDADRFGLSQLHQLRGRVGRGAQKSWCILVRDEHASEEAKLRLRKFAETVDGFQVAESDLQARGSGDFFGTRQSGMPNFRFGDLIRDVAVMERARDAAVAHLREHGARESLTLASKLIPDLKVALRD